MAAGDPGVLKRNFSATAIQTSLVNSISSAATGDTTTSVAVISVSGFPSTVPYTLILDPDGSKEEVVTVTAASSTTLTITRGQDNTPAVAHSAGTSVRHGVSGRDFKEEQTHIAARGYDVDSGILSNAGQTHVHGLQTGDGSVVGADQVATLTRKTLTTPVINGATLTGTVSSTASIVVSGAGTITGLSSAGMSASSAAPKSYVDAILVLQLASAASSATSASMAATSATSAATSASSALTSQTAAATSATSAAASASASASSAAAAATSATSAATSATSAATSATSAAASASASASSASAAATSASSALTSQTAAATSATSAAASATAAATSATSAAASATTASNSAATATTQAGNAATSASSAATSAASAATSATASATSAGASATSATAAATSATSAAASATAATTSATSAAASATAAATSATTATTQATNAATSATSAAASATAAATSATSASASATAAATSATSAAASYDSFDDRYLGAKAVAPTLDNDGNALLTGALYWNTAVNKMYVWSGTAWGEISSSADIIAYKYTATGGATSVSGADDNGLTLTYTVGKEQVYINGVLQVRGSDYTASTGSSITGMAALTVNDIVTVLAFTAFSVANTYTQAEADAKFFQTANAFLAGKNKIINGDFFINQRVFTTTTTNGTFGFDRWFMDNGGIDTVTYSAQTFTAGDKFTNSSVEGTNFARLASSGQSGDATAARLRQRIEDVRTFADQIVTVSFWAKASTGTPNIAVGIQQVFGAGGSTTVVVPGQKFAITSSWVRYSKTFTIPSISGKTIGAGNNLAVNLWISSGANNDIQTDNLGIQSITVDFWGVQVEAGSVATAFQTATGTIQGELAACQRYYYRQNYDAASSYAVFGFGWANTASNGYIHTPFLVKMRTKPSAIDTSSLSNFALEYSNAAAVTSLTSLVLDSNYSSSDNGVIGFTKTSAFTVNQQYRLNGNANSGTYIGWSAEL
jgi:hypothetical protein